jgi:cytochrome c-type biogenesis protein CcmF
MQSSLSLNLIELGHFCAFLAFAVAMLQGLAPIAARALRMPALANVGTNAAIAVAALTTLGGITLIHAFIAQNYSVLYVAMNSNSQLPLLYKVTALWGGHEGSLYLWVWVLTVFTLVVAWHGRRHYPERLPAILAVQGWLMVGFFGLILFLSDPFTRLFPVPADGRDLNPLLQDPGMAFHPPMLYLGYVGFSVPFAFAIAALLTHWKSELWVAHIRRWALIAWGFLTVGILLGGWWSYYELGWGGYWAWDPVENASFMPWLVGTALVHSIGVQERRRMLHAWNIFLVITTFSLSLLGTFLVRSGVLSSVHAFAVDPGRGAYILGFMTVVLTLSFGTFLWKGRYQEAQETVASPLSRESLFVWNNVMFTVAAACVLLGTLYPLVLEAFSDAKITVGPPYFNAVMIPLFLLVLALMGVAPLVPWRKANLPKLRARLLIPAIAGIVVGATMAIVAAPIAWTGPVAVGLVTFVFGTLIVDIGRVVLQRRHQLPDEGWMTAVANTLLGNRRHYGGMVVHLGILVIALGLVGSGLFRSEKLVTMAPGDAVEVGGERLRFEGVSSFREANYLALQGKLVSLDGRYVLTPERRRYPVQEMPTTEASIHSTPLRDVYAVIAEAEEGRFTFHLYVNPLVQFIWIGGAIIIFGLGFTLSYKLKRVRAAAPALSLNATK